MLYWTKRKKRNTEECKGSLSLEGAQLLATGDTSMAERCTLHLLLSTGRSVQLESNDEALAVEWRAAVVQTFAGLASRPSAEAVKNGQQTGQCGDRTGCVAAIANSFADEASTASLPLSPDLPTSDLGAAGSVGPYHGLSTQCETPFEERAIERDMEIERLAAIIRLARSGCKEEDQHSLVRSALSNYRAVLCRLTSGFISDHTLLENKRPCVSCAHVNDEWSPNAVFSHLETCKLLANKWSYLKDTVRVRQGIAGATLFATLSSKVNGLYLFSERGQIHIPEQVCPKYKRVLYKVYSGLGYIVKIVDANDATRDPTEEEMKSSSNTPTKIIACPGRDCAVAKVRILYFIDRRCIQCIVTSFSLFPCSLVLIFAHHDFFFLVQNPSKKLFADHQPLPIAGNKRKTPPQGVQPHHRAKMSLL